MNALPIILAVLFSLACFALAGAFLCRDRSISRIVERLHFDAAMYARTLLITGAPIGLLGWLAARHPFPAFQEVGLVLTIISAVIYAVVPVFVLRGFAAKLTAEMVAK